jgi:glycosyltransferase involved in cell wall biosynthesis
VDSQLFQPDRRSDEMRSRLTQGQPANPLLLYVGRLSAEKEIERLKPILQALPQARLALVGDGPHRKPLERHFAGLPVFMAGFLRGEELAAAYASSDVLVMPSRTETLGLVVLEAMSAGLPVVAARAGGIPEMIRDGVSGFLFDRESEAVAAIRQLMQSAPIREQIGKAAREHAVEHSWKAATSSLLEHYRAACEQPFAATQPRDATAPSGPRISARQALKKTTLFTLRKLFP